MTLPASNKQREIAALIPEIVTEIALLLDRKTKTCINCAAFDEPLELCRLAGTRPPARVIARGCPAHEEMVPF